MDGKNTRACSLTKDKRIFMNIACMLRYALLTSMMLNPLFITAEPDKQPNHFTHYHDKKEFIKKVSKYIEDVKANAHLEQNLAIQDLLDDAALELPGNNMRKEHGEIHAKEFDDLKKFLQHIKIAIEQVHIDDQKAVEQVRSALLLRAAVPLYFYIRHVLLDVLKHIDKQIISWEYRASHPHWYFMHKSPLKWFAQKSQKEEIQEKLKNLHKLQRKHFQLLGELTAHVGKFDTQAAYEKQYEWLIEFLSLSLRMYDDKINKQQLVANKLALIMNEVARRLPKYYQLMNKTTQQLQAPGHFEKNWLGYTLLAAGTTAAGVWLLRNYQRVPGMMQSAKNNVWNRLVYTPYKAVKDAFLGDDAQNNQERIAFEQKLEADLALVNKVIGDREPDTKQLRGLFVETMNECVNKGYIQADANAINRAADAMINPAQGNAQIAIDMLEHAMQKSIGEIKGLKDVSRWSLVSGAMRGINETGLYVPLLHIYGQAYKMRGQSLVKPIKDIAQGFAKRGNKLVDEVERTQTQLKAVFAMSLCVPTAAVIYGGAMGIKGLINKMKGRPEYRPIRSALIEIEHILNLYNARATEMEAADYGRLLYLIFKLKDQSIQVPAEHRSDFLRNINKLESSTLPAEHKMNTIRFMYDTYEFLAPNYR